MYSRNKYYRNVEEYVQDLTGYTKKESDGELQLIGGIWVIVAILAFTRFVQESISDTDSILLVLAVTLLLPAVLIACAVLFFKNHNDDKKKERELYIKILWAITRLPRKSQCMEFDQVFANLIARNLIDQQTIERIKKLRVECYDDRISSSQELDKLADYAEAIDEAREKCGIEDNFDDEIAELRKEAAGIRNTEKKLQIEQRNETIRNIRDKVIVRYPELKNKIKLDSSKLDLLERKYREIRMLSKDYELYTGRAKEIEGRFLKFVEGYFMLSTASIQREGIKEAVEKLVYDESDVNSVMDKINRNKPVLGLDLRSGDIGYRNHLTDIGVFYILTFMLANDMLTESCMSTCSSYSFSDWNSEDCSDNDVDDYAYISDDESYLDDDFDNDRFGYDSEAFDFDMDGFDDNFR
ncbi:MAG: hypothetical protein Q4C46_06950 [Bacillota bacterium]|nr:hypothetical protein [Bacillota bacterium]